VGPGWGTVPPSGRVGRAAGATVPPSAAASRSGWGIVPPFARGTGAGSAAIRPGWGTLPPAGPIDADTNAFNDYLAALGLPKDTPEQLLQDVLDVLGRR